MYKVVKLKTIATILTGFPFKGELYSEEGIRVVRGENVTVGYLRWDQIKCWNKNIDQISKYLLKVDDVVIGMDGSRVGKNRAKIKEENLPLLLAQRVACLRSNEYSEQKFLYYLIRDNKFEEYVKQVQTGSSIPHISQKQIEEFPVALPPLSTQRQIAAVLSSLDAKIELNNTINAVLEAMAKTIYDYWFVQFDFPYSPPLEGCLQDGAVNGKPYKSSGGKMVYNAQLKREIPEGWEVELMEDWIDLNKSGDWGKEEEIGNYNTKVNCIRGADINGVNGLEQCNSPERFILEKNAFKILKDGDFVVEISGGSPTQSTGRIALITDAVLKRFSNPVICSNFCKPISMKNKKISFYFLKHWLRLYNNNIFFGFEGKTSGIKNLLFESLVSSNYIIKPPENILDRFNAIVTANHKKQQQNLLENQQLTQLRDWLLPMLMNGQVTVQDAYAMVNEQLSVAAEEQVGYGK